MHRIRLARVVLAVAVVAVVLIPLALAGDKAVPDRNAVLRLQKEGNFQEAYDGFRRLLLAGEGTPGTAHEDLGHGIACLKRLGRRAETDAFLEEVIARYPENARLLASAADAYMRLNPRGRRVAGDFERGRRRGGGERVSAQERDRARALQLFGAAARLLTANPEALPAPGEFYLSYAAALRGHTKGRQAWQLQALTDLEKLPDYLDGWYHRRSAQGAPVDPDGTPVFHRLPESFEAAKSDAERWRWVLLMAEESNASTRWPARREWAGFLQSQFGVQTLNRHGRFPVHALDPGDTSDGDTSDGDDARAANPFALHTLDDSETIARLASGIRRFALPDEFNHVKIYHQIGQAEDPSTALEAVTALAIVYENRRQYPRAAEQWQRAERLARSNKQHFRGKRAQITGNWGRFERSVGQAAGRGAEVDYRFRNGGKVTFTAHALEIEKLIGDVMEYIRERPARLDWRKVNIGNIGWRLVQDDQDQYLGAEVAHWDLELDPARDHFDRLITVTTPLEGAGAYLLTARMADGNTTRVILWLDDTAVVGKPTDNGRLYFVADARDGRPLEGVEVEFFGYHQRRLGKGKHDNNQYSIDVKNFVETSDADGCVLPDPGRMPERYQWVVIARTPEGRLAYHGFSRMWYRPYPDVQLRQRKAITITDRPVYRPGQTVHWKIWVAETRYDQEGPSAFAGQPVKVEIHDPRGEKIFEQVFEADDFGGVDGELALADDATLGRYSMRTAHGRGSFRVEEYKKPEFEVTVEAPEEPVTLGDKVSATIRARYYYGEPVREGTVHYRVYRSSRDPRWFPHDPWDWLYGNGYWWYGYDYDWYPGFGKWGCYRPYPWYWWRSPEPPELVAESEVAIGENGTITVEIDTAVARALYGDQAQQYRVVAEVVDRSRRTIVGTGQVVATLEPYRVYVWPDRGHARVGDTIEVQYAARTADGKPVTAAGEVQLVQIRYDPDGVPTETAVATWPATTDDDGRGRQKLEASSAGQYRLRVTLKDERGRSSEGAYIFHVTGEGFAGADYRFNDLELIPDQRHYRPGDTVRLLINTRRPDSTVVLWVRPRDGIYLPPKVLRLQGRSTVEEIGVARADMPNFHVEAFTIRDGVLHTEARDIAVPPEERVLNVEVLPSAMAYRPGETARVQVRLTDAHEEPVVASMVLSIYDRSVEYISGGSNVPEIREFFWKWKRTHRPQTFASLGKYFWALAWPGETQMGNIGIFGHLIQPSAPGKSGKKQVGELERKAKSSRMRGGAAVNGRQSMELASEILLDSDDEDAPETITFGGSDWSAGATLVEAAVRKKFADTALWVGSATTDATGRTEVSLEMPENLTSWKVRAWAMGQGTRVGQGEATVVTRKNLVLRLQAPRFFTERDEVVLSANIHNYLTTKKRVKASLALEGDTIESLDDAERWVEIEAGGEARVDWRVKVIASGEAVVRMQALTDEESDAMELRFPVHIHGMLRTESYAGALRPDQERASFTLHVPEARRVADSRLEIRYSPSVAAAMVDALPYLAEYPHGCTEQTLNRFLPAVVTRGTLSDLGLDLAAIRDKRANLNAAEIGDARERAKQWQRFERNPVFDEALLGKMVNTGLDRLTEMQLSDGGWGWFSGWKEHSTPHTTATVVHGLLLARRYEVPVLPRTIDRGIVWLRNHQERQITLLNNAATETRPFKRRATNIDAFVFMVLVEAGAVNPEMLDFLYRDRIELAVYTKAMLALALGELGEDEKLAMVKRNIAQFLVPDDENQTVHLKLEQPWWYWYGSEYEALAYTLKLYTATEPESEITAGLAKYLLNNRKHATYWNSTRDTAIAIEALAGFVKQSGELDPDMTVEVWLGERKLQETHITKHNLFSFNDRVVLTGDAVTTGTHELTIRRRGRGPLYFNAYLTTFTLEEPIAEAGLELRVDRKLFKLIPEHATADVRGQRGQRVTQRVEKYRREELADLSKLTSGDLVEVELTIETKNDYEYLVVEDLKGAGFEPEQLRSGYGGNALGAYMELRDRAVCFFLRRLPRGKHSLSYRLRAEIPGRFAALPTLAYAMYAPELRGNSDEIRIHISDP